MWGRERVCDGSQSVWPNKKAPHTRTNALNPPASSLSPGGGAASHGGARPPPQGRAGCSQGIVWKICAPELGVCAASPPRDVRRSDRQRNEPERGGRRNVLLRMTRGRVEGSGDDNHGVAGPGRPSEGRTG